jgi:hypothetical protein
MIFGGTRILISLASLWGQITKVSIIKWSQQKTVAKSSHFHQGFGELDTDRDEGGSETWRKGGLTITTIFKLVVGKSGPPFCLRVAHVTLLC